MQVSFFHPNLGEGEKILTLGADEFSSLVDLQETNLFSCERSLAIFEKFVALCTRY